MVLREHIELFIKAEHWNPYELLGPHQTSVEGKQTVSVRAFVPDARETRVISDVSGSRPIQMNRVHEAGLFEAVLPKPNGT